MPSIEHPVRTWAGLQQPFSANLASRSYSAAAAAAPAASPPPQEGNEAQDEALHLTDSALEVRDGPLQGFAGVWTAKLRAT